jgi:putative ABC transport system ATP-binding protein
MLEAHDLVKRYDLGRTTIEALRGVSISVAAGEFLALMGPSGSGKSTLLQLLGGLDHPTSGTVVFEGHDISRLSDAAATQLRRERTGFVFQAFNLIPLLSVVENIALPFTIAGHNPSRGEYRDRIHEVIELVDLTGKEGHRPDQLSQGEQQRVAVARAVARRPPLLLADEPTGNLDSATGKQIIELLVSLNRNLASTLVLVTHDAALAAHADRVVTLRDGAIVSDEPSAPTPP